MLCLEPPRPSYASNAIVGILAFFHSTHYAGYQGAIAARNILLPLSDPGVLANVPATTFTSPEVASLGLTEAAAAEMYGADKIVVAERELSDVDRAVCDGAQVGFIKIIYLKKNGKILGATVVAPVAGEMISEIAVMMKTGMPFDQVRTSSAESLLIDDLLLTPFCSCVVLK
jgi:pyruvate/2-oxoglutarate dehydrogenase complex dihydrolipoamide dehydrogenase (E3) component